MGQNGHFGRGRGRPRQVRPVSFDLVTYELTFVNNCRAVTLRLSSLCQAGVQSGLGSDSVLSPGTTCPRPSRRRLRRLRLADENGEGNGPVMASPVLGSGSRIPYTFSTSLSCQDVQRKQHLTRVRNYQAMDDLVGGSRHVYRGRWPRGGSCIGGSELGGNAQLVD